MTDAWIIAPAEDAEAETAVQAVAGLGFRPRRMLPGDGLAPRAANGQRTPQPAVAIIVRCTDVIVQLRDRQDLVDVPILLAVDVVDDVGILIDVDEVILLPYGEQELTVRIARARKSVNGIGSDDVITAGEVRINVATYEVRVGERLVDLTYMEYELLKFLITNPQRVFSREALLSRVWGYDYYGGVRTVDVHVRRLRLKLGPEHAARLKTVRSVGYRFDV